MSEALDRLVRRWRVPAVVLAAATGLIFLFCYNPQHLDWFPRCPFLALTGLKCPGCGTLRGIHSLLHLRFADAWGYNPLMVLSIPLLVGYLVSARLRNSAGLSWLVFGIIVSYWIGRNIFDW